VAIRRIGLPTLPTFGAGSETKGISQSPDDLTK
jgi:hypothetical protein